MDKQKIRERQLQILDLIKAFANKKLNDEYVETAERLITKIARRRMNLFEEEKPEVWAAVIVFTLGTINFLFDKSSQPYATVDDINVFFKTNKFTISDKSKELREMLNLTNCDDEFSIQRMEHSNRFNRLVLLNGSLVPLSSVPHEYHE